MDVNVPIAIGNRAADDVTFTAKSSIPWESRLRPTFTKPATFAMASRAVVNLTAATQRICSGMLPRDGR
jgi:hypothetical protein